MPSVDASIIIVNYNTRSLLERCLASLPAGCAQLACQTIVVDNGSTDGSQEMVRSCFPHVELVESPENLGFAHATNAGIRAAEGRVHIWLNSDCEVTDRSLATLVRYLDEHDDVGVVGPRLEYPDGRVQPSAQAFPSWLRVLFHVTGVRALARIAVLRPVVRRLAPMLDPMSRSYVESLEPAGEARETDWLSGACLAARSEVSHRAGLLDEGYFMYCEDTDWCHRVHETGYQIDYLPSILVVHHVGASGSQSAFTTYHYYRSLLRYFGVHRPRELWVVRTLMLISFALRGVWAELGRLLGGYKNHPWWRLCALVVSMNGVAV